MTDAGIHYPWPLCPPPPLHPNTSHIHTWQLNPEMPFQATLLLCYASSMVWCTWNCWCFLSITTYFAKHCTLQQSTRDHALRSMQVALCEDNHNQSFPLLIWLKLSSLHAALKSHLLKVSAFTWKLSEHFHFIITPQSKELTTGIQAWGTYLLLGFQLKELTYSWDSSLQNLLTVGIPA